MHFRILEMIATSGFLTALECTKFVFGQVSAPDPAGGVYKVYSTPQAPHSWFKGDPTSTEQGRGGKGTPLGGTHSAPPDTLAGLKGTLLLRGRERERRGRDEGGEAKKGGEEGRGGASPPYANSWIRAPVINTYIWRIHIHI